MKKHLIAFAALLTGLVSGNAQNVAEEPVEHAVQLSVRAAANRHASKEFGIDGAWKQQLRTNMYFNGGISLAIDNTPSFWFNAEQTMRNPSAAMFEVGIPLQIEFGKLNYSCGSFYGLVGVTPTFYSTMSYKYLDQSTRKMVDGDKKSGFIIAPVLEAGRNFTAASHIFRFGLYATYKFNCTPGDFNIYHRVAGRMFVGVKLGMIL